MINVVSKSANLSPYLKATSQAVASSVKPLVKPAVIPGKSIYPTPPVPLTSYALTKLLPSNDIKVRTGPTVTTQVRWAHTDIQVPDFSSYRRKATRDPTSKNVNSDESRKAFTYLIVGGRFLPMNVATTPPHFSLHRWFQCVGRLPCASCAGTNGSQSVPSPDCRAGDRTAPNKIVEPMFECHQWYGAEHCHGATQFRH
ncbi:hypothetical protein J6590_100037 [Homalodisca vitripennis]|nr:hypothetical protein J6590_100037 [Homalodisca vitripennis]